MLLYPPGKDIDPLGGHVRFVPTAAIDAFNFGHALSLSESDVDVFASEYVC
jgi:hypothetical protein